MGSKDTNDRIDMNVWWYHLRIGICKLWIIELFAMRKFGVIAWDEVEIHELMNASLSTIAIGNYCSKTS